MGTVKCYSSAVWECVHVWDSVSVLFCELSGLNNITSVMKGCLLMFIVLLSIQGNMQISARVPRQEASSTVSGY